MKCLGCGGEIPWDGSGAFAYTCPCGATVFYDKEKGIAPPASLMIALHEGKPLAHIDYYVGLSSHESELKREFIKELRARGAIWSWECGQCRERFLGRQRMLIKEGLLPTLGFHPDLEKALQGAISI